MFSRLSPDRLLGLILLVFACVTLFVWIPLDTESGYFDTVRRRLVMGDALAPTFAGALLALSALGLVVSKGKVGRDVTLTAQSLRWILLLLGTLLVSLVIMRFAGPLVATLTGAGEYRVLRDTLPWKYIGFLLGGTVLTGGLICVVERRLSWQRIALGFVAVLIMALLYDLPFEDLLLPPNGDV